MAGNVGVRRGFCKEGKVALTVFFISVVFLLLELYGLLYTNISWIVPAFSVVFVTPLLFFAPYGKIVRRSALLGIAFAGATCLAVLSTRLRLFGIYFVSLSFFHFSEYITTAIYKPESLGISSFLLNHSFEYKVAAVASWIEYFIELYFFPTLKSVHFVSCLGIILVVIGEGTRKLAMVTAGSSFHHIVQTEKASDHKLVTHGVYSLVRHPSYTGWFLWSVGTQVLLCNPVCLVGYAVASWQFFNDRIMEEEVHLIDFFGYDYVDYILKVPSGVPFVSGLGKTIKNAAKDG